MPVHPERTPLADAPAEAATALLVVDMISTWDFDDAERLGPAAVAIAPAIATLARRCSAAGIPVIYANDNRGRWRSEFSEIVRLSSKSGPTGAEIAELLRPGDSHYAVLKPKHSAFFATPLDLLLRHLRVERLVVTGVASDLCVAMTASEARMRDYEVVVPTDCVAAVSPVRNERALQHLGEVHGMETTPSAQLRL